MVDKIQLLSEFDKLKANVRKGVSGTGGLLGDMIEKYAQDRNISLEPGDIVVSDGRTSTPMIQVSAPIAYDLWYLKHAQNIRQRESSEFVFISGDYLAGPLAFLTEKLGGIKPLKVIANIEDLVEDEGYDDYFGSEVQWKNDGQYFAHELAFETWVYGISEFLSSDGPPYGYGFKRNSVFGYLAFPIGQLGVIEVISIFRESITDASDYAITDELKPNTESTCDFFFPPVDDYTGRNICIGDHIVESGYVFPDDARRAVEYPANPQLSEDEGFVYPDTRPQLWLRYWIHGDEQKFIPGEFVAIICKPLALPPHPWWFQETSPFMYAGAWMETKWLTGGIVKSYIEEENRTDEGIGRLYVVKVKGYEIQANASDLFLYEANDRVIIIKVEELVDEPEQTPFMWTQQKIISSADENTVFLPGIFQILPLNLYSDS